MRVRSAVAEAARSSDDRVLEEAGLENLWSVSDRADRRWEQFEYFDKRTMARLSHPSNSTSLTTGSQ